MEQDLHYKFRLIEIVLFFQGFSLTTTIYYVKIYKILFERICYRQGACVNEEKESK